MVVTPSKRDLWEESEGTIEEASELFERGSSNSAFGIAIEAFNKRLLAICQALMSLEEIKEAELYALDSPRSALTFLLSRGLLTVRDNQGDIDTDFLLYIWDRHREITFGLPKPITDEEGLRIIFEVKRFMRANPLIKDRGEAPPKD